MSDTHHINLCKNRAFPLKEVLHKNIEMLVDGMDMMKKMMIE